jgi:hypothetical protein
VGLTWCSCQTHRGIVNRQILLGWIPMWLNLATQSHDLVTDCLEVRFTPASNWERTGQRRFFDVRERLPLTAVCRSFWHRCGTRGPSAWELACHALLTGTSQVSRHHWLSASARRLPVLTPLSGTQRARRTQEIGSRSLDGRGARHYSRYHQYERYYGANAIDPRCCHSHHLSEVVNHLLP